MNTQLEVFRALLVEGVAFWFRLLPDEIQNLIYDGIHAADQDVLGL